jgi:hypothetical protein
MASVLRMMFDPLVTAQTLVATGLTLPPQRMSHGSCGAVLRSVQ